MALTLTVALVRKIDRPLGIERVVSPKIALRFVGLTWSFTTFFSGWEGSAADQTMFQDARVTDLFIPLGRYYLADAGFPSCSALLIPFRGTRYHLQEWGRANRRYVVIVSNYLLTLICLS